MLKYQPEHSVRSASVVYPNNEDDGLGLHEMIAKTSQIERSTGYASSAAERESA